MTDIKTLKYLISVDLIGKSKNKKKVKPLEQQWNRKKEERIQERLRAMRFFDCTSSENENECPEISPEKITSPVITTEASNSGQSVSMKNFPQLNTLTRNLPTINDQTAVSGEANAYVSTEPSLNHHVPVSVADDIPTQIDEAHVNGNPNSNEYEGYHSPDANDEINKIANHQNEENVNEEDEDEDVRLQEEANVGGDERHGDDEELGDEEHDFEDISDEEHDFEENVDGDGERRDNEELDVDEEHVDEEYSERTERLLSEDDNNCLISE